jgi:hypothetical protein
MRASMPRRLSRLTVTASFLIASSLTSLTFAAHVDDTIRWHALGRVQIDVPEHYGPGVTVHAGFHRHVSDPTFRALQIVDDERALAGEMRFPASDHFDLTCALVWIDNDTRERVDTFSSAETEDVGDLYGDEYELPMGVESIGPRELGSSSGAEAEIADHDEESSTGLPDPNDVDAKVRINALSFGVGYWATERIRFTVSYVLDPFPGWASFEPFAPSIGEATVTRSWVAYDEARTLHELLFRAAVAF